MSDKNLIHSLIDRYEHHSTELAIRYKDGSRWQSYRWQDVYQIVGSLAAGLKELGIAKGDRVAIMSETRPEWLLTDLAIFSAGAVTVPIYPNLQTEDVEFILNNSESRLLVLEDVDQLHRWNQIKERCPNTSVVLLDTGDAPQDQDWKSWASLLDLGRRSLKDNKGFLQSCADAIQLSDVATLPYTSGTTGKPKGVVLTHEQVMSELSDVFNYIPVNPKDQTLTFLPQSHILGRVETWGAVFAGFTLGFAESIDRIRHNLLDLQPTFLIAVPRIFEKLYSAILSQTENNPLKKRIFDLAISCGRRYSRHLLENTEPPLALTIEYQFFDRLVFSKIREKLGGKIRFAVSGGAPLPREIAEFFHAVGVLILEGYGLTETTAGIAFNTPFAYRFGTVGKPLPEVQIRIADDGEILVKSKKVMKEYFQNPGATEEAFDQGFFKTGDIGELDADGFLKITDRKKDLIKTAAGKYVAPQKLESLIKKSSLVANVLIHGDQRKYVVALITLNQQSVQDFAKRKGLSVESFRQLAHSREIQSEIKSAVSEANGHLASFESIKKFLVLDDDFTVENGFLTPSMKVKRRAVETHFANEINSLYAGN